MNDNVRYNIWGHRALDELRGTIFVNPGITVGLVGRQTRPPRYGMTVVHADDYAQLIETAVQDVEWQRYLARAALILLVPPEEDVLYPSLFEAMGRIVSAVIRTDRLERLGDTLCGRQLRKEIMEFPYRQNPLRDFFSMETFLDFDVEPAELRAHLEADPACRTRANAAIRQFALFVRAGFGILGGTIDAIRAERLRPLGALAPSLSAIKADESIVQHPYGER